MTASASEACLLIAGFGLGVAFGLLISKRWRRQSRCWAQRKLQLVVLSLEIRSLREKVVDASSRATMPANRQLKHLRPSLEGWHQWWIARLRVIWPWLTRFMHFSPQTYVRWLQRRARQGHHAKTCAGRKRGRPPVPEAIVDLVIRIKRENPRYSPGHIARIIANGELRYRICKETVAKILRDHGFRPRHVGKRLSREEEPGWITTLYNQHVLAIDFKCVLDLAGNTIYIFNVIDHGRRILHLSVATYRPSALWVEQQIRNVLMAMEVVPDTILMDRDSIFAPIAKRTLPSMGIKPLRTAYKCPWQNAVVERFHRTLNEELLRYVQPLNDRHLNRLLREFQLYYNSCRPHMSNGGEPPLPLQRAEGSLNLSAKNRRVVRKIWLGGLHSIYGLAA